VPNFQSSQYYSYKPLTSALDAGGWSAPRTDCFTPGTADNLVVVYLGLPRYSLYRRQSESQGRPGRVRKISLPPGLDPRTVLPVASRYTD
jgi:hypothetical protein